LLVVVGLGNPGPEYRNTRHNVGFMLVDGIADGTFMPGAVVRKKRRGLGRLLGPGDPFEKSSGPYVGVEGEIGGRRFLLAKPTTYMNESGRAVLHMVCRGVVEDMSEMLVVLDDVNLPLGRIRLRERGSSGGQKGLQNIIDRLGTDEFNRLRIGIGPAPDGCDLKDFVLSSPPPREMEVLEKSLRTASTVVEAWLTGGFEEAQTVFSRLMACPGD